MSEHFFFFRLNRRHACVVPAGSGWPLHAVVVFFVVAIMSQGDAAETSHVGPQFVLLRTDRVVSGTVESRDSSIVIRQGHQAELVLASREAVAIANSMEELYRARIAISRRRTLPGVDGLISDLRWCVDNDMPVQATALIFQLHRLSPNHPVALQLEGRLRNRVDTSLPNPSTSADPIMPVSAIATIENVNSIDRTGYSETMPDSPLSSTVYHASAAPQSLHLFTARIQPILVSRCGQCHCEGSQTPTSWNLILPPSGNRVTQQGSVANLRSTIAYCTPSTPESSDLIVKATSIHGGATTAITEAMFQKKSKPPIAAHEMQLIHTLQSWIALLPDPRAAPTELTSNANEQENQGSLKLAKPDWVTAELQTELPPRDSVTSREQMDTKPPSQQASNLQAIADPIPATHKEAAGNFPSRLPIIETPDDIRHFNRQTELLELFRQQKRE